MKINKKAFLSLFVIALGFNAISVEVPKQFEKESIVIIKQDIEIEYLVQMKRKRGKHVFVTKEKTNITFLLNDKLAVEAFSEYYIPNEAEVTIKIIKPDNKEYEVDLSNAVTISSSIEVPLFKKMFSITEESKKIAIPDLEVGDQINYIVVTETKDLYKWAAQHSFEHNDIYLLRNFPILKQRISIKYGENVHLNYMVFNSKTIVPVIDEEERTLTIEQQNLPPMKEERFVYDDKVYPSFKYEAIYVNDLRKRRTDYNISNKPSANEGLNTLFLKRKAYSDFYNSERQHRNIVNKVNNRSRWYSDEDFFRFFYDIFIFDKKEEEIEDEEKDFFITLLAHALHKRGIEFEIGYTKPRNRGDIFTAISATEFEPFIYVKHRGEEYYFFTPGMHNFWNSFKTKFDGCEAYLIKLNKNFDKVEIRTDNLPVKAHDDNMINFTYDVTISDSLKSMRIVQRQSATGFFKESVLEDIVSFQEMTKNYLNSENRMGPSSESPIFQNTLNYVTLVSNDVREENFKERYNNLEYISYSLLELGRGSIQNPIEFEDVYTVIGTPFKMNEGIYGCRLNRIILPQNYFDPNDTKKERELPIFLPALRQINNTINIKLPENAIIENIQDFNFEINKSFLEFKSVVKEGKNGKYTINITTSYKELELPAERWLEYVETINAIYDFSLTRLIITEVKND